MLSDPTATQRYTKAPIANFYFTAVDGLFRCRCGAIPRQTSRTGYSTLMQHVRSQHPDFADVMSVVDDGRGTLQMGLSDVLGGQKRFLVRRTTKRWTVDEAR
ncbi:hypothetical protein PPTG_24332 [Phytophthora nicotianae INRA-310]|uniref:BED-type domain-containing protein n=1 Tax=Phytophthora nicotianae (strain INRA-310) TaxID=761204 RepID=W2PIX0_PHYN3|nr:hypothetical protein PPTG_24332 [Phytophthora nicotianae INRA-310]ETM99974.1 hypothetical protein PPTG_24332 [Phytophthora nicotianae INRA-310]